MYLNQKCSEGLSTVNFTKMMAREFLGLFGKKVSPPSSLLWSHNDHIPGCEEHSVNALKLQRSYTREKMFKEFPQLNCEAVADAYGGIHTELNLTPIEDMGWLTSRAQETARTLVWQLSEFQVYFKSPCFLCLSLSHTQ